MTFPTVAEAYLRDRFLEDARPFCFEFDDNHKLLNVWGDAHHYQLGTLASGQDMTRIAPFIADYDRNTETVLPFVTDSIGNHVHVQMISLENSFLAIYLDATTEFKHRRVAQQKANEARLLSQSQHKLIAELVDARAELDRRRLEAEEESRRKGAYIAMMSHDFRTPLTSARLYAELLGDENVQDDDRKKYASSIVRVIDEQLSLVNNLLKQAKLEAEGGDYSETIVDIRACLDDISVVTAPLAAEKGLGFAAYVAAEVAPFVRFDDLHVRQIIVNVIANAIKFTEDGAVSVVAYLDRKSLVFQIEDSGPGISAEDQDRVFHAFERGSAAGRRPGAGLGLAISKRLAENMGGNLTLQSEPGTGTVLRLELPYRPVAAATVTGPSESNEATDVAASQSVNVLLIEDDIDIRELLTMRFERAGYSVAVSANADDGINLALRDTPDIVIMDINLPGKSGLVAARELREQGLVAPILGLSAADTSQVRNAALASGFTEFVQKPVATSRLLRQIEKLLLPDA